MTQASVFPALSTPCTAVAANQGNEDPAAATSVNWRRDGSPSMARRYTWDQAAALTNGSNHRPPLVPAHRFPIAGHVGLPAKVRSRNPTQGRVVSDNTAWRSARQCAVALSAHIGQLHPPRDTCQGRPRRLLAARCTTAITYRCCIEIKGSSRVSGWRRGDGLPTPCPDRRSGTAWPGVPASGWGRVGSIRCSNSA
jgi:hypothetical protein